MSHPRTIECVLAGFISDQNTRDAVLGDFAEEWHDRAGESGTRSASRWYVREAIRTVPSLVVEWFRSTGWLTIAAVLLIAVVIRCVQMLLGLLLLAATATLLRTTGLDGWLNILIASCVSALSAFGAGWLVARLFRSTPAPAVLWLSLLALVSAATLANVEAAVITRSHGLFEHFLGVTAVMAGGAVQMRRAQSAATRTMS